MSPQKKNNYSLVSVIIAVYNPNPVYFKKAVLSVLDQKYPVHELVLVNDGGCDSFCDVLPEDHRIKVFSKRNEGVAATRNFAITQCSGEYIAFLDQDDYWYPDKLQEQMLMIPSGVPCMVCSSVDIVVNDDVIKKLSNKESAIYQLKTCNNNILLNLVEGNFIYSSTPVIHSAVFEKAGFFDPWTQPHDDWDMYLRVVLAGFPIYFYQRKPLSVWRGHDFNESNNKSAMIRSRCRVEKKLLETVADENIRRIAAANLLVDYVERANLLYNKKQYARFRSVIRYHLYQLLRNTRHFLWTNPTYRDLSRRVRHICLKSTRRYVVSLFLS